MADVAALQHREAVSRPAPPPQREPCAAGVSGDGGWHEVLRAVVRELDCGGRPPMPILDRLNRASAEELDGWAEPLLAADLEHIDPAAAPFLAAAIQVQRTLLASRPDARAIVPDEPGYLCPVCGFLPVASLLQTGGEVHGLRYLVCGLCGSQWHRTRSQCVHCGSAREMGYYGIEGGGAAVQAEACGDCRVYLKILNREKDPQLDPVADDLASLSLDLLMAQEGYRRLGFNPLLIPGGERRRISVR